LILGRGADARHSIPGGYLLLAVTSQFFKVRAQGGSLHLWDIGVGGSWDQSAINFQTEEEVNWLIRVGTGPHWRVNTVNELEHVLVASQKGSLAITLYVHDSLLGEVKRRVKS